MTAWIFSVSSAHPENLSYGFTKGYWDTPDHRDVEEGDELYFWVAGGGSLSGVAIATSDPQPIARPGRPQLEDLEPVWGGTRLYKDRIYLEPYSTAPIESPTAGQLLRALGYSETETVRLRQPFAISDERALSFLRSCFHISAVDLVTVGSAASGDDYQRREHRRSVSERVERVGQATFRKNVMAAYAGRCAVTGEAVEETLEAAHILDYGSHAISDRWNGVLLRADIHRLFDARLLQIDATGGLEFDTSLEATAYWHLRERTAFVPRDAAKAKRAGAFAQRIALDAIAAHDPPRVNQPPRASTTGVARRAAERRLGGA
ncbi:HNH endonuclease signature motif containing protein [Tsukamurella sp. NPDC003166]|uniref:HNH endonuclease n=1 Tax=Tsukamurella sp. NPDC003166 TaxID=3154444 RepID=UPI0033BF730B